MATDLRTAIRRNTLVALVNVLALTAPGTATAEINDSYERILTLTDQYWNGGSFQSVLANLHAEEARLEGLVCNLWADLHETLA